MIELNVASDLDGNSCPATELWILRAFWNLSAWAGAIGAKLKSFSPFSNFRNIDEILVLAMAFIRKILTKCYPKLGFPTVKYQIFNWNWSWENHCRSRKRCDPVQSCHKAFIRLFKSNLDYSNLNLYQKTSMISTM